MATTRYRTKRRTLRDVRKLQLHNALGRLKQLREFLSNEDRLAVDCGIEHIEARLIDMESSE